MPQQRRCSGIIIGLLSLGLLAGTAVTASPAQAASGPGPYYAEPAWDRKMGAGRFLILTNWNSEAVLDKETGLVWESPRRWRRLRGALPDSHASTRPSIIGKAGGCRPFQNWPVCWIPP